MSARALRVVPCMLPAAVLLAVLGGCKGGSTLSAGGTSPPPVVNTLALTVDGGPAAAPGAINHAYVTVTVCAPGSQTQCTSIDHVLLDTDSIGLRLVGSVLAAKSVSLAAETDGQGNKLEECVGFGSGQTWGPVARADVSMAGEAAAAVPVQVMDATGTGAPAPSPCGAPGTLLNGVGGFTANGVLGVGVFAQDCGAGCTNSAAPPPVYYGCSTAGVCTAESVALADQVANPVASFAADNNGVIVALPSLQNANGDASVTGELIFGIGTQTDNALPTTALTILGTDANGDFTATYNGGATALPASIDSGTDAYYFDDPSIAVCTSGAFLGYYCPAVAPQSAFAVNTGVGANNGTGTVDFAIADPNTFVANATAFANLATGRGATRFTWGMPFFYGRRVYVGIEQKTVGNTAGPLYAY